LATLQGLSLKELRETKKRRTLFPQESWRVSKARRTWDFLLGVTQQGHAPVTSS
jgi:hypothetical protein